MMAETFADPEQDNQRSIQTSADPEPDKQRTLQTSAGHFGRFCDLLSMNRQRSRKRVMCENPAPAPPPTFFDEGVGEGAEWFPTSVFQ
jgi:hypothetical protein